MTLVLALGTLGVGYALWSETLVIGGTVDTGEVSVRWVVPFASQDTDKDWTCDDGFGNIRGPGDNPNAKAVGSTTVWIVDDHTVGVILDDVYPSYFNKITLSAENIGTIPVILAGAELTYSDPDPNNPGQFLTVPMPDQQLVYIPGDDQYGGISNVIEVMWGNNTGAQIDPGDQIWTDSFSIHILQPAKQGSQYSFTITREAIQWNEY